MSTRFDDWSADQHRQAGNEALEWAVKQPNTQNAVNYAAIAAAHYAAAEAIVAKHRAEAAGVDSRWSWRGAKV